MTKEDEPIPISRDEQTENIRPARFFEDDPDAFEIVQQSKSKQTTVSQGTDINEGSS